MSIEHLTIAQLREIAARLDWSADEKRNGQLWLAKARKVKAEYGLHDEDVLRPSIRWETIRALKRTPLSTPEPAAVCETCYGNRIVPAGNMKFVPCPACGEGAR